jgi:Holliday junction resolvase RusA-like endonuclease
MVDRISFFIPGVPKSTQTGSIVRIGKRAFPKRMHTEWSAYVKLVMQEHRPDAPWDGALLVELTFQMPRLASGKRPRPIKRPDVDNLLKGFLDCGNGVLWHDDSQVCHLDVEKVYADNPGVTVTIQRMT